MLLDNFSIFRLIVQVRYPPAFELWDRAGRINRAVTRIWPDMEVVPEKTAPNQVILKSKTIQVDTGFDISTVSLSHLKSLDSTNSQRIVDTFDVWRKNLDLDDLNRVSSRVLYVRNYPDIGAANNALFSLVGHRPSARVFDQPENSPLNTVDLAFKFEDEDSFSFLRLRTEFVKVELTVDPDFSEIEPQKKTINRLVIDFDRGLKKPIKAQDLRMDDWLKGFQHVLRRDLGKVIHAG